MNRKGFSIVELLITAVVLCVVLYFVSKNYLGKSGTNSIDTKTKAELSQEGVKTDSLPGMVDSAKAKADEFNKQTQARQKEENKQPE